MQGAQVWPLVRELRFPHAAWHSQKINKSFLKYNKIDTFGCGKPILKSYTAMYQFKFLQWFLLPGVRIWLSQVGSQVSLTSPEDSSPDSGPADSLATSQAWVAVTRPTSHLVSADIQPSHPAGSSPYAGLRRPTPWWGILVPWKVMLVLPASSPDASAWSPTGFKGSWWGTPPAALLSSLLHFPPPSPVCPTIKLKRLGWF